MKIKGKIKVKRVSMGRYVAFKRRGNYWIYANGTTVPRVVKTLAETIKTMKALNAVCEPGRVYRTYIEAKQES